MKIKRIEIIGFKSFVDRTVLEFPPGVTAVVGPNGCGKSNVVDAIRWVMGEQSAKNLRGRAMEDIIFAGSESRRSLGMAEVSLVFSTDDGRVPAKYLDYSEIQVTRRLYRDGESEYSLNKTPCRLLDINELFMDTGVGARAYSIIEQGRIGMILMAKPEERRFLIEEAAGVTKFKARKQVALKKIESTRQNLFRIGDVVAEIKRQLGSLQRQAKKAERFRYFREELKKIEIDFAVRRHRDLDASVRTLESGHSESTVQLVALAGQVATGDSALEERRLSLLEEERSLTARQEEIFRVKAEYQGAENRLDFQRKELASLERQRARTDEELTGLIRQQSESGLELKQMEEQRGGLFVEAAEKDQELSKQNAALETLLAEEAGLVRQQDGIRQTLVSLLNKQAQFNNQHGEAGRRLIRLAERSERSKREGAELAGRLATSTARVAELHTSCHAADAAKRELALKVESLIVRTNGFRSSMPAVVEELQTRRDELSSKAARLASLLDLEARFAGYGQGVRSLFLTDGFKDRFAGLVADLVETDAEYEAAVEAALEGQLQYVACQDEADAIAALEHLQGTAGGRCSFLLPGWGGWQKEDPLPHLHRLLDHVRLDESQRLLVEPLLADVYLAEELAEALRLSKAHPRVTFVTRVGEVARAGGILTGGSAEGGGQGLIHAKREIRELAADKVVLESSVSALESERNRLRGELSTTEDELRQTRQELHKSEVEQVGLEKDLQSSREELQRLEERRSVKALEDDQLAEEKAVLEKERTAAEGGRGELEQEKALQESASSGLQEALVVKRREIDLLRETVTGLKVLVATIREKREANQRAVGRVEELRLDLSKRLVVHQEELAVGDDEQKRLAAEIALGEGILLGLVKRQLAAELAHGAVRERFDSLAATLQEQESAIKGLREKLDSERTSAGERQLRLSGLVMELRHLESSIQERHRLDIATLKVGEDAEYFDDAAMRRRQEDLQRQVDELGEVNLMAIEECRELEARHSFLSEQKTDLEESLQSLQTAIQRINRTTRKRFMETFQLVNDKFKEVFPRLFCGGQAELRLTNEEDLLETGIEIIVQPPGKKLQNVSLLSGGEKALTAVALIFSIFLVKPSPFCLLDEVDAPLDDANIGRFNEMIREMTAFSQFILITHSKTTMAVADTLYGVTMEEPGVSKVVSVCSRLRLIRRLPYVLANLRIGLTHLNLHKNQTGNSRSRASS